MISIPQEPINDLPALLDLLTVAVTTLDSVGVEQYRDLRLHVVGLTGARQSRALTVDGDRLVLESPSDEIVPPISLRHIDTNRRMRLVAELHDVMSIWGWSCSKTAGYLGWQEATLSAWLDLSSTAETPPLPQGIVDKVTRLLMVDQARYFAGIPDEWASSWLRRPRPALEGRSAEDVVLSGDRFDFVRLMMWALERQCLPLVH